MKLLRVILLTMTSFASASAANTVQHSTFGHMPDGKVVELYTLKSPAVELRVMTYGGRVVSLETKDRNGKMGNITLGYADFKQWLNDKKTFFGAVPGRYANRIANGKFTLEGKT